MPKKRRTSLPAPPHETPKAKSTGAMAILLSGTIALCFEIGMYRDTVISFGLPFCLFLLTGIVSQPIAPPGVKGNLLIIRLFYCTLGYGGLLVTSIMFINYNWLDSEKITHNASIVATGHRAAGRGSRCRPPYAIVNIDGIEKMLLFQCDTTLKGHSNILVDTRKGLLGFDVIVSKALSD